MKNNRKNRKLEQRLIKKITKVVEKRIENEIDSFFKTPLSCSDKPILKGLLFHATQAS